MIAVPLVVHSESSDAVPAYYTASMSFDANGGSGAPETQEVTLYSPAPGEIYIADYEYMDSFVQDMYLTIPEQIPQLDGYTFLGWKLDWDDTLYQPGEIPMLDVSASGYGEFDNPDIVFRAVWISDELSDQFYVTSGSGTIDDPFTGKIWTSNPGIYPKVFFVEVGTEVSLAINEGISVYNEYNCDDGFGLSITSNARYTTLKGTLVQTGIFHLYGESWEGSDLLLTMHVVDKTADLEFLSDPVADGVVSYHDEPAAPAHLESARKPITTTTSVVPTEECRWWRSTTWSTD